MKLSTRCLTPSATPSLRVQLWQFVHEGLGGGAVSQHAHGPVLGPVDDRLQFRGHVHRDGGAFGQVAADHAAPVLAASPLVRGVRVGEIGGHARGLHRQGVAGELAAVVHRHADPGPLRQVSEQGVLGPEGVGGAFVGDEPGLEVPGLALDLGVRVAAGADDAVGLPMAEPGP